MIYVEIPMLPLLGIEESRRFIFLNMRESGAVGKGGAAYSVHGRLSQLADVRVVGRPVLPFRYVTCGCLLKLRTFVSTIFDCGAHGVRLSQSADM